MDKEGILIEADKIVGGGRGYREPCDSFEHIARIASAIKEKEFTPDDCCVILMAVKLAREEHEHKRDNLVDLAGYTKIRYELKKCNLAKKNNMDKGDKIKTHKIISQEVRYVKDTISLLNSMVIGGKNHSETSKSRVLEAMSILNNL